MWTDTFWTNPQFRVTVVDGDEGDADNTGTLIVALLQKQRRGDGEGCELLTIGYAIYMVSYTQWRTQRYSLEGRIEGTQRGGVWEGTMLLTDFFLNFKSKHGAFLCTFKY